MEPTLLQSAKEPFKRNTFAFCLSPHTLYPYFSEFCISLNVFFCFSFFSSVLFAVRFFFLLRILDFCLFVCILYLCCIHFNNFCYHILPSYRELMYKNTGTTTTIRRTLLAASPANTPVPYRGIGSSCFVSLPSFTFSLMSSSSCESDHYSAACPITCFQRIFFNFCLNFLKFSSFLSLMHFAFTKDN